MTIGRMRFACWAPKTANTHGEYAILIAFPMQQWLQERVSMLRCAYIACLFKNKPCQMGNEVCYYRLLPPSNLRIEGQKPFTVLKTIKTDRTISLWISPCLCAFVCFINQRLSSQVKERNWKKRILLEKSSNFTAISKPKYLLLHRMCFLLYRPLSWLKVFPNNIT